MSENEKDHEFVPIVPRRTGWAVVTLRVGDSVMFGNSAIVTFNGFSGKRAELSVTSSEKKIRIRKRKEGSIKCPK